MKRIFKILLVGVISLAVFSGCSNSNDEDMLSKVKAAGEIVFATEGTWTPWTYHDGDELIGYDVEFATMVAEKLGVKATFVEAEWDSLFIGLETGRYDVIANGVEINAERSAKYNFSSPYAYIRTAVIVREDNNDINSFEDLNGKTTANTLASTYATLAESYGATPTGVDDLNQTMELVLSGRVDATLNAEVSYYSYMALRPEASLKIVALTDEASEVAFTLRKGEANDTLLEAINTAIAELVAEGKLAELSNKYFGSDISSNN